MKYWTIINGVPTGPMDLEQLISTPGFGPSAPVWAEGMPDWTTAARLDVLRNLWGPAPGTVPPPCDGPAQPPRDAPRYAPGQDAYGTPQPCGPMPPTYLVWAILLSICCCPFTGIVAIIYASKVNPLWSRGDYAGAERASERAGLWIVITLVASLIWGFFAGIYGLMYN